MQRDEKFWSMDAKTSPEASSSRLYDPARELTTAPRRIKEERMQERLRKGYGRISTRARWNDPRQSTERVFAPRLTCSRCFSILSKTRVIN